MENDLIMTAICMPRVYLKRGSNAVLLEMQLVDIKKT